MLNYQRVIEIPQDIPNAPWCWNIDPLVNVYKKLWKITMLFMGKLSINDKLPEGINMFPKKRPCSSWAQGKPATKSPGRLHVQELFDVWMRVLNKYI